MASAYIYGIVGVLAVSVISFAGVFVLAMREDLLKKYISVFISLATGALLGDAFIHLIPEALQSFPGISTGLLIISGVIMFFILEKILHWHHHGEDKEDSEVHPMGKLILFSDGVHNFVDGLIIGGSFLVSTPVGIATTVAVILHEIPQEVGDFAVLLHAGYSKARAMWLNFASAVLAIAGAGFAFLLGEISEKFSLSLLAMASGGFIYVALADLIPELQKTKKGVHSAVQIFVLILGVASMAVLTFLE